MAFLERFSIWNWRAKPTPNPLLPPLDSLGPRSIVPLLPSAYCHWCQNSADCSPGLCSHCDRLNLLREFIAECVGVFLMMTVGTAATAQMFLSSGYDGSYGSMAFAWGMATAIGIYSTQNISGAHLSPAITVAFAATRKFPWRRVPVYVAAQLLGCLLAGLVVFAEYREYLHYYEAVVWTNAHAPAGSATATTPSPNAPGNLLTSATSSLFVVQPAVWLSTGGFIVDQLLGSFIQCAGLAALTDLRNSQPYSPANIFPLLSGLWVSTLVLSFGVNSFFAYNPGRDFGMQLAAFFVGYGGSVFYSKEWTMLFFPAIGAVLGFLFYDALIKVHHTPLLPYHWTMKATPPGTAASILPRSSCSFVASGYTSNPPLPEYSPPAAGTLSAKKDEEKDKNRAETEALLLPSAGQAPHAGIVSMSPSGLLEVVENTRYSQSGGVPSQTRRSAKWVGEKSHSGGQQRIQVSPMPVADGRSEGEQGIEMKQLP